MSDDAKQFGDAVRIARDAVVDLEEPLKTEAFKILLEKLVSGERAVRSSEKVRGRKSAQRARPKAVATPARKQQTQSQLKLDVASLRTLKAFSERFDLQGTEQIAFVLANFAREHTDLETINAADIAYLYRQLVSQRVKVTAVNDAADWGRALNWLTAPSRRKEWLEKRDEGFVVSNSGLLRFHELEEALAQRKG